MLNVLLNKSSSVSKVELFLKIEALFIKRSILEKTSRTSLIRLKFLSISEKSYLNNSHLAPLS